MPFRTQLKLQAYQLLFALPAFVLWRIAIGLGAIYPADATEYCVQNWACSDVIKQQNEYQFWLINKKPFPITQTLWVKSRNLQSKNLYSDSYEVTLVVEGRQRIKALVLFPYNADSSVDYRDEFYWTPGDMHAQHDPQARYQKPFAKGKNYRMVQGFGGGFSHTGASKYAVDFAMSVGSPVHAARGGVVIDVMARHNRGGTNRKYAKFANYVVIMHGDRTTGEYYHLKKNGVAVSVGQIVKAGELIGYSGNTGFSSLPHLHFAVYRAKPWGRYESLPFKFVH